MPIVNHTVASSLMPDGSTSNVVRMYDQEAVEYMQVFHAPAGFDVAGRVALMIAGLDVQLAENEFNALIGL